MKARRLLGSSPARKLRYGGWTALAVVAVAAVAVAVNVLVAQVPARLDLTENRMFSLSDQTRAIVQGLSADITITSVSRKGSEDALVREILARYARLSPRIRLATVDPERNPGWAKKYDTSGSGLREGSLVVARAERFRVIDPLDMYNYDVSGQQPRLTGLSVEQKLTAAIQYVGAGRSVTAYTVQGHGEKSLADYGLASAVDGENYERRDLNLLTAAAVPADADILLVLSPRSDFPAQDAEKLRAWLAAGGRALFLLDLQARDDAVPNLAALLQSYGVAAANRIIVEPDPNRAAFGNPLFLVPEQEGHEILAPLQAKKYPILMPFMQPVRTLELRRRGLKIEPLLRSTEISIAKEGTGEEVRMRREPGDPLGPFALAVAVTDPGEGGRRDTRLVVVGGSSFLVSEISAQAPGNTDFFLNSMGWLREKKDALTIRAKSMINFPLNMTATQRWIFSAVVVIVIPLLVLGLGLAVWIRRRHL